MIDIYEENLANRYKKNMQDVPNLLATKDESLLDKIIKNSIKYSIDEGFIKEQINNKNPIALAFFCINPTRQNIFEKVAADFLKKQDSIKSFKKLSNNAKFVVNGVVIEKIDLKTYPLAKTIDFEWRYNEFTIYASHKYTKDSGGAQDNQYNDVKNFIKQARDFSKHKKTKFLAICDGKFYETFDTKVKMKKIEYLQSLCTQQIKVCNIYNVIKTLQEFTQK